jgi:hypothetical protein
VRARPGRLNRRLQPIINYGLCPALPSPSLLHMSQCTPHATAAAGAIIYYLLSIIYYLFSDQAGPGRGQPEPALRNTQPGPASSMRYAQGTRGNAACRAVASGLAGGGSHHNHNHCDHGRTMRPCALRQREALLGRGATNELRASKFIICCGRSEYICCGRAAALAA